MIMFWIVAALIAAGAAVLMAQTAARAASEDGDDPARQVYRRQLAEFDDLVARGLMSEADLQVARAETGRRLLRLSQAPAVARTARSSPLTITLAAAALPLLALAAYMLLGQSGTPDQPFAQRLAAWRAADPRTLDAAQMAAILQSMTTSRPRDPALFRNLAVAELASGDPTGAVQAMRHAATLAPRDPALQVSLGEALMMQNQNRLNPAATQALAEALRLNPGMPEARYVLARGHIAGGDVAGGLAEWRALLADLPANDERRAGLVQQIDAVTRWGGLIPPASESPRGGMDAAIRGMVAGLAARLQSQPDDPQGWIRLVRAYTVLHETAARDAALASARARYRGRADILRGLDEATRAPVQ